MPFDLMLVDDSAVMRSLILRVIRMSGFELGRCREASDGLDAINQLDAINGVEEPQVNAVLTDINMPRMDGEDLVRRIRERAFMDGIPIVVISTDATHTRIDRLLSMGAQGYVTKPFSPEGLRRELERVLPSSARVKDELAPGELQEELDASTDF